MTAAESVVVLMTIPGDMDAARFAETLVRARVAACVNVLPMMTSVYRWEGAIERAEERQLVVKTTAGKVGALRRRVAELHPYETPEFLVLAVADGDRRYLDWVARAVGDRVDE
jgi:periplasmic divalent cation tolerance protein